MPIVERYTNELHQKFNHLAVWLPGTWLTLGTIGAFNNQGIFVPKGHISQFGISVDELSSPSTQDYSYHSADQFDFGLKLGGEVSDMAPHLPIGSAGVGMSFEGEGALFFQLGGVQQLRIGDQITLEKKMVELAGANKWERRWIVVTEVVRAERAVILISESLKASAEFTVAADMSAAGLEALTAEAGASLHHFHSLETKIEPKAGPVTPLFRAVRVNRQWFVGPNQVSPAYGPAIESLVAAAQPDLGQAIESVDDYGSDDDDAPLA